MPLFFLTLEQTLQPQTCRIVSILTCNNAVRTLMFITVTVLGIGQVSVSTLACISTC